ncbi:hypothetical protein BO71DRAFT_428534 [Aspergillus ellipticus CBS 707.79]|uniref:Uncharacterized protein n=1 Tax=Aspergillus ellipticus CBS 707.79 TaxID=1448320 RepID=A0A319DFH3_9EURO|nr:hypothetical protein BO71DRAFT_428534 [Aspergillus ellipticus CBS 707.79]
MIIVLGIMMSITSFLPTSPVTSATLDTWSCQRPRQTPVVDPMAAHYWIGRIIREGIDTKVAANVQEAAKLIDWISS